MNDKFHKDWGGSGCKLTIGTLSINTETLTFKRFRYYSNLFHSYFTLKRGAATSVIQGRSFHKAFKLSIVG